MHSTSIDGKSMGKRDQTRDFYTRNTSSSPKAQEILRRNRDYRKHLWWEILAQPSSMVSTGVTNSPLLEKNCLKHYLLFKRMKTCLQVFSNRQSQNQVTPPPYSVLLIKNRYTSTHYCFLREVI